MARARPPSKKASTSNLGFEAKLRLPAGKLRSNMNATEKRQVGGAHAFVTYQECWGADVLRLWWLVIRLSSFPAARKAKEDSRPDETEAA